MDSRWPVLFIVLVVAVTLLPAEARGVAPTISNLTWTPWVPAHGENVTIEADVASPGGPANVSASWCLIPSFTCRIFYMDFNANGRYATGKILAQPGFTGAHFNVTAIDPGGNLSFTPETYVQFATNITIDATFTPGSAAPGQRVDLAGTALYEGNSSAPAKFSAVDFHLETRANWSSTTDSAGAFMTSFSAPTTIGTYAFSITVTNRTISGVSERYLAVAVAPTPDLAVVSGSLRVAPSPAVAGQIASISVSVENRGTAAGGPFTVRFNVTASGTSVFSRSVLVPGLGVGGRTEVNVTWPSVEGSWTVGVLVDSGAEIVELSEMNNQAAVPYDVRANLSGGPSVTLILGLVMLGIGVAAAAAFAYRLRAGRRKGL